MAGGPGERFWPLSTRERPKQFINLFGHKSLLQQTVERIKPLIPEERILVATGKEYEALAHQQLPDLPKENLVLEPMGRDTAACIGLASLFIERRDPRAIMVTLPSDHYIPDQKKFLETLSYALEVARSGDWLVTLGIKPTRAETGYGYIKGGEKLDIVASHLICNDDSQGTSLCATDTGGFIRLRRINQGASGGRGTRDFTSGGDVLRVERFVEKPDLITAQGYLAEGTYYWNSGMFIWRNRVIQSQIAKWMPKLWQALERIKEKLGNREIEKVLEREFIGLEKISVDYGILEKAKGVVVIPAPFPWDDLGSWAALDRIIEPDKQGNIVIGKHFGLDTRGCIVYGDEEPVATLGLSGLIIIRTKDGTLICSKDRAQEIKKLLQELGSVE